MYHAIRRLKRIINPCLSIALNMLIAFSIPSLARLQSTVRRTAKCNHHRADPVPWTIASGARGLIGLPSLFETRRVTVLRHSPSTASIEPGLLRLCWTWRARSRHQEPAQAYRWCRHITNLWFIDSTPSECCSSVVIGELDKDEKNRKNNILHLKKNNKE
jgi:hypothetical protein